MHYQIVLSFVLVSFHCVTKENPFLFLGGKALRSLIVGSFSRDHIAVLQYEGIGHEKKKISTRSINVKEHFRSFEMQILNL